MQLREVTESVRSCTEYQDEKLYRKGPSCSDSSNSEGAGADSHGGNLKPFKFDPFQRMICSDFGSSLFEIGSFSFRGRLRISRFGGEGDFSSPFGSFEALIVSALRTRSLHFESKYFL
jgi:hypothetical protein